MFSNVHFLVVPALCVVPMYPGGDPTRIIVVVVLVVLGVCFFSLLSYKGKTLVDAEGKDKCEI